MIGWVRCPHCLRRERDDLAAHLCSMPAPAPPPRRAPAPKPAKPAPKPKPAGRTRGQYLADVATEHGTKRRYQYGPAAEGHERPTGGCGCPACTEANRLAQLAYRQRRRALGTTPVAG